jgi:predicted DNA-binding protein (UPF0251 family)
MIFWSCPERRILPRTNTNNDKICTNLREVHAIRLKIYDEIKDMTAAEITDYHHEGTMAAFSRFGITPKYTSSYNEDA